jgi:hypothetical protein
MSKRDLLAQYPNAEVPACHPAHGVTASAEASPTSAPATATEVLFGPAVPPCGSPNTPQPQGTPTPWPKSDGRLSE